MTLIHILNFSIPIGSMIVIGYLLDRYSKPKTSAQKTNE